MPLLAPVTSAVRPATAGMSDSDHPTASHLPARDRRTKRRPVGRRNFRTAWHCGPDGDQDAADLLAAVDIAVGAVSNPARGSARPRTGRNRAAVIRVSEVVHRQLAA